MKELKEFNIDIFRLNTGRYNYDFEVNKAFFEFFNFGLIENGNAKVTVVMDKSETLIQMEVKVKGTVEQICDRSLETFDYPIDTTNKILFKFGDRDEEVSYEIVIIERNTLKINLAQHIYDFISLSIPMKKIHPRFAENEEEDAESEGTLVYSSQEIEGDTRTEDKTEDIDPRWNALKNLKTNNN